MSDIISNYISLEILDIARYHSLAAYILFFVDGFTYMIASKVPIEKKKRSVVLGLCPLVILLISLVEIVVSAFSLNASISSKAIELIGGIFIMPPTNLIFAYVFLRNWRASKNPDVRPIHWGWFVLLMLIHVPLGALTLALSDM